jgi:hypothetical protein
MRFGLYSSGGPAHAKIMDAIELFGDRVLPHCR